MHRAPAGPEACPLHMGTNDSDLWVALSVISCTTLLYISQLVATKPLQSSTQMGVRQPGMNRAVATTFRRCGAASRAHNLWCVSPSENSC